MATQQIQTNPQNGNLIPSMSLYATNPFEETVAALRGIASRFQGKEKEFEALFTTCIDGIERQEPTYENSLLWADALFYLVEYDPDSRRGVIVEDIARRLVKAYEDDYLPQPPKNDPPFSSDFNKVDPIGEKKPTTPPTRQPEESPQPTSEDKPNYHSPTTVPSIVERESIFWQLQFIAIAVGSGRTLDLTENGYCGLMNIIFDIANKVFPESNR